MTDAEVTGLEFRFGGEVRIEPQEWEQRVEATRRALAEDGIDVRELFEAVAAFSFTDGAGWTWMHDGASWRRWDGTQWTAAVPAGPLTPQPFHMEVVTVDPSPPIPTAEPLAFRATHYVPDDGLTAWESPDASSAPAAMLDPALDVMVIEWLDNGWAKVRCSNNWDAWVDGRRLLV